MHHNINRLKATGFFDIKPGLERITRVLNYLVNPQDKIKYILIAGTNGKGSVASILSEILTSNRYKTGLYTSPHLISVTERIKIDNKNISQAELNETLEVIFNTCTKTSVKLSYFELVTVCAFLYFERQKIDIGILEVGMGGRWDATNVITPLVSVITNISIDHVNHLGNTTELIAREKAEIIKEKVPVVSGVTGKAQKTMINKAKEVGSDLFSIDRDFNYEKTGNGKFNYYGIYKRVENLVSGLVGTHQMANTAIAVAVCELIDAKHKIKIDIRSINKPLSSVRLEGRFEIVNGNPLTILDCAHNIGSAQALVNNLHELKPRSKYVFLLGMLNDKDHKEFIATISRKASKVVVTTIPNERGTDAETLFKMSKLFVDNTEMIQDYKKALKYVKSLNMPTCITGSIYLIGLAKQLAK